MRIAAGKKMKVTLDGVEMEENMITLIDDRAEHNVVVAANKTFKNDAEDKHTKKLII